MWLLIISGVMWTLYDCSGVFLIKFMALFTDAFDGFGLTLPVTAKKTKV